MQRAKARTGPASVEVEMMPDNTAVALGMERRNRTGIRGSFPSL